MKKFLVFLLSFIIIFTLYEIVSGLFLTVAYTPEVSFFAGKLEQGVTIEVVTKQIVPILLIAAVAYFISQWKYNLPKITAKK